MLRELNENEMMMVSGGDAPVGPHDDPINSAGGAGNEVVVYGTRSSLRGDIRRMNGQIAMDLMGQGFFMRNRSPDLQRQLDRQQELNRQLQEQLNRMNELLRNHDHRSDTFGEEFSEGLGNGTSRNNPHFPDGG